MATTWTPVASEVFFTSGTIPVGLPIADGSGMSLTVPVYGAPTISSFGCTAAMRVETVVVTVNVTHVYRGDLQIVLISPTGVQSILGTIRNDSGDNYTNWSFSTVKDWGEYAAGTWTLQMRDGINADAGSWVNWSLAIYGTAANPMPQPSEFHRTMPNQVQFRFPSAIGTAYQIFQSTTLEPLSWQALGPKFTATATESIHNSSISPGMPRAFFLIAPVH